MGKRRIAVAVTVGLFAAGLVVAQNAGADGHFNGARNGVGNGGPVNHIVVIYEENHSFDNLYGLWGPVNGDTPNGLAQANLGHTVQVSQAGTPYTCLLQNDVNLKAPSPLTTQCIDPNAAVGNSHFINLPFKIDDYIKATDTTCPPPGVFAANGVLNGSGLPGRVHRGPGASLLPRAVPDRSRDAGQVRDR